MLRFRMSQHKTIFLLFILVFLIFCFIYVFQLNSLPSDIKCYSHKSDSLPSILESKPAKGRSIFFLETSCNSEKQDKIVLTARQACAVESAAKLNTNFEVYLLFVSPGVIKNEQTESDRFLDAILSYENVKIRHLDFADYIRGTPVEPLWTKGTLQKSLYLLSHTSDVLSYLTLWRYGGIYLDLDVIVIKPLENLPLNYAGAESDSLVASGVLSFEPIGAGHVLVSQCLNDLRDNFNGTDWISNGPAIITRLSKNICASETVADLIGTTCLGNFRVYPPETFYPVAYQNWTMYFKKIYRKQVMDMTKDSYVVHMRNKLSLDFKIGVGSEAPYALFAEEFCPRVYSEIDNLF